MAPHRKRISPRIALPAFLLAVALPLAAQTPKPAQDAAADAAQTTLLLQNDQPVRAPHGMVVTVHHLATDAGVGILQAGGNAVDAAVATGFALAVVHPVAGNLGGGGFMLIHEHTGKATFIDYREKAPLAATPNMYLDATGQRHPQRQHRRLLAPSASRARSPALPTRKRNTAAHPRPRHGARHSSGRRRLRPHRRRSRELHDKILTSFPDFEAHLPARRQFLRDGRNLQAAGTRARRCAASPPIPTTSTTARWPTSSSTTCTRAAASSLPKTWPDTPSKEREPSPAPITATPSSARLRLPPAASRCSDASTSSKATIWPRSAIAPRAEMHLIIEAFRRAYMDRTDYLGDPDYDRIPIAELISKKYAAAWRASHRRRSRQRPAPRSSAPPVFCPRAHHGRRPRRKSTDTTHYSVVDAQGNAVSVTTTLNDGFGSDVTGRRSASCSTTRWTTSPRSWACPICSA